MAATEEGPSADVRGSRASSAARTAGHGTSWSLVGYAAEQVIRLASNLILTRLLLPEHFGTMLIVNTVFIGLHLFTDFGILPSVIQNERGDEPIFLDTAWTIQAARGGALFLGVCVFAPLIATFYEDPQLKWLLPVVGLSALFEGLQSTRMASHHRHIRLKPAILVKLTGQLTGVIGMIVWALSSPTVWALAVPTTISTFVVTILTHTVLKGSRNRLRFDRECARILIRFGRWIFVSTLLMYFTRYSDRLIVSKAMPRDVAGVYGVAVMLAGLVPLGLSAVSGQVAFPLLSRVRQGGGAMLPTFRGVRAPMNAVGGWAVAGVAAGAPVGVRILWPESFHAAGWMVQLLLVGVWPGMVLCASYNAALLASGNSRAMALTSAGKLVTMTVSIPVGYFTFGLPGLILGFSLAELARYGLAAMASSKLGLRDWEADGRLTGWVVFTALAGYGTGLGVEALGAPPVAAALTITALVTAAWWRPLRPIVRRVREGRSPFSFEAETDPAPAAMPAQQDQAPVSTP